MVPQKYQLTPEVPVAVVSRLEVSRTHIPPQDGRVLGIAVRLVEIR